MNIRYVRPINMVEVEKGTKKLRTIMIKRLKTVTTMLNVIIYNWGFTMPRNRRLEVMKKMAVSTDDNVIDSREIQSMIHISKVLSKNSERED